MANRTRGEKIFNVCNIGFMLVLMFIMVYPLWYVFIASFSNPGDVVRGNVVLLPIGFELSSLKKVLSMPNILTAYGNTIFYSVVGTGVNMLFTILAAYPLSKQRLRGRKLVMGMMLFSMWFSAGMLPTYLNYRALGLLDSRLGIIFSWAISTFYMILLRTFFENVPDSMEESAKIDGAKDPLILLKIYLPLSIPALAAITLYYFVDRWNAYFWSMLLLSTQSKVPLQVLLRRLIVEVSYNANEARDLSLNVTTEKTVVYSTIVISVIPMLVLYPFIQRFFVKGIMVGAIKG